MALLFSDGLDDDVEKLEQKSEELRKEGMKPGGWCWERSVYELYNPKTLFWLLHFQTLKYH